MADIDKSGAQKDEWAQIAVTTIRKGSEFTFTDDLGGVLEIFVVHDSTNAHANGAEITVEVNDQTSGNDEGWIPLESFNGIRSTPATAVQVNVDVECAATTTQLKVDSTGGSSEFETKMDRYFVKNATIANSEIVRNNGFADNDYITLRDGLTNTQEVTADVFNVVYSWLCRVPQEFRRARVTIWNDDADCTICSMTREAKATDIA